MSDRVAAYLEASRQLQHLAARCDGFVADLGQCHVTLQRWQRGVVGAEPAAVEAALAEFFSGELPRWTAVQGALQDWVTASRDAGEHWAALTAEERAGLEPPAIQSWDND